MYGIQYVFGVEVFSDDSIPDVLDEIMDNFVLILICSQVSTKERQVLREVPVVNFTIKKHVKKPSGSKPGMVIYETNSTIYVTPTEELVVKLKNNK